MSLSATIAFAILLATSGIAPTLAQDAAGAAPALVAFNSDDGIARLARAKAKADFAGLANQFEAQSNIAFCGPTTAAIVLNTARNGSPDLPRDRSRLRPGDTQHLPGRMELAVPRFTQDNVIDKGPKTRAQVLGEPMAVDGKTIRDAGYQLRQFDALLRAHDLATRLVVVDDALPEQAIRADLIDNLRRGGDYVIVNYRRRDVGQPGGGHISPLGAYDEETDSVLVMDVNPASAGWVWMPVATLVKGMRTLDTVENRGYILVQPR